MGKTRVAVLGMGTMGAGMAANLLKGGFPVTVWNRTASKAAPLGEQGAMVAATPAEAARGAEVVIGMLSDDAASREAWTGKDGALEGVETDAVLVEASTVSPVWVAELAGLATDCGTELLDAPVLGSRVQAEGGQLTFLVGGSEAALAKARPALEAMSKDVVTLGPSGSGARMKLINNFLCAVQIASLAEGLTWIERSGLDRERALGVLKNGAPGSPLLAGISARMTARDYTVNFLLDLMTKDLVYATAEAATVGVELKTAAVARSLFNVAQSAGFGEKDMSAVIEPLRSK